MKTLLLLLLTASTCLAQYRYYPTTVLSSGTNGYLAANSSTNVSAAYGIGASTKLDMLLAFSLISTNTNAMPVSCTNSVVTVWETSADGSYYTNRFTFSVDAVTNLTRWNQTNIDVSQAAWIKFVGLTNNNAAHLTNYKVFIGYKTGL
jgi:hypothetical protein